MWEKKTLDMLSWQGPPLYKREAVQSPAWAKVVDAHTTIVSRSRKIGQHLYNKPFSVNAWEGDGSHMLSPSEKLILWTFVSVDHCSTVSKKTMWNMRLFLFLWTGGLQRWCVMSVETVGKIVHLCWDEKVYVCGSWKCAFLLLLIQVKCLAALTLPTASDVLLLSKEMKSRVWRKPVEPWI